MRKMANASTRDRGKRQVGVYARGAAILDTAGQSLVELALVVPIAGILLLGAAEFGVMAYQSIEVADAARAGVAYGSQSTTSAADTSGMQTAATNAGSNVSGLTATAKQFWSCSNAPSTQASSAPTCTSGNHVLHYVQVKTSVTVTPAIHVSGLTGPFTLRGLAIMRVQ